MGFGGGGMERAMMASVGEARRANQLAIQASEDARKRAAAAMVNPADSEAGRLAAEQRMRRLLGITPQQVASVGPAPVGFKMLMGQ